jgi:hypothetical protein
MGKTLLAWGSVFVSWVILDFVIHGVILGETYASQPELWRPQNEMKLWVVWFAVAVAALAFVWIYSRLVSPKSLGRGLHFGLIWGIGVGIGMGYGTYAVMPIPYFMAIVWFFGTVVEAAVAGLLVGAIVRDGRRA